MSLSFQSTIPLRSKTRASRSPAARQHRQVYFYDIGDYLNREEKPAKIEAFGGIAGISAADGWKLIVPDAHGDWLTQRDGGFDQHIAMGDKDDGSVRALLRQQV